MFQHDVAATPRIIYRRPTGRLMRPSDRMIATDGLGNVDGVLDIFKNFGSGIVQAATAGLYDPRKNRFYVPFSSGQMRNLAQGVTNTSTLGLVKTDKFFNSNTAKTVGTIAGVAAAGATAYFGGQMLMKNFGGTPAPGAPGASGSNVYGPPTPITQVAGSAKSLIPSLDTVSKTLDITSKLAPLAARASGAQLPSPMEGGQPPVMIINQPSGELPMGPSYIPNQAYGYGYDPTASYSNLMPPGGNTMYTGGGGGGGGGGGVGPPGSEYQQEVMDQQGVMQPVEDGMGMGTKVALVAGVGILGYLLFAK